MPEDFVNPRLFGNDLVNCRKGMTLGESPVILKAANGKILCRCGKNVTD